MVVSNLAKQKAPLLWLAGRGISAYIRVFPLACTAVIGIVLTSHGANAGKHRRLLLYWLIAAWLGYFSVPNMYTHYLLPVLVPLCVASGLLFSRRDLGLIFFLLLTATSLGRYQFWSYAYTKQAQNSMASMTRAIKAHDDGRGLLIFDGPLLLYSYTGNRPMSPLAFPPHLNYAIEEDVSHMSTVGEVTKILARRPGAVVISKAPRNKPFNATTLSMVRQYVKSNCRLVDEQWSNEMFHTHRMQVYGDCAATLAPPVAVQDR